MREGVQAIGARAVATTTGRRWPGWIVGLVRRDPERARERIEVIERMAAERRQALRAGEYVPDWSWRRRWG
jgi:hypothetical protein